MQPEVGETEFLERCPVPARSVSSRSKYVRGAHKVAIPRDIHHESVSRCRQRSRVLKGSSRHLLAGSPVDRTGALLTEPAPVRPASAHPGHSQWLPPPTDLP